MGFFEPSFVHVIRLCVKHLLLLLNWCQQFFYFSNVVYTCFTLKVFYFKFTFNRLNIMELLEFTFICFQM